VEKTLLRSRLAWLLIGANLLAILVVAWLTQPSEPPPEAPSFRIKPVGFDMLPGWAQSDPRRTLEAFRRSCVIILNLPAGQGMGWENYAGTAATWWPICASLPGSNLSAPALRAFFEKWFTPLAIGGAAHFTGYYEPELTGSWFPTARYNVPVYGRPQDLITADLGTFRHTLTGEHISGRLEGAKLVPYPDRADIDAHGLSTAPILLYTDDPVSMFFLQIQGSGRVKLSDGKILRLSFAARNGRPYTSIGRVLVEQGALARKDVSLQSIRAWLAAHGSSAQSVMEADQSYVFFSLEPLGDPSLGSTGTEGVALTPGASIAVDPRLHPFGAPVYVSTNIPDADPAKPERGFEKLLIAQDTGGAIRGPARGDIFLGAGRDAEAVAGRLNAHGQFFVLVPKAAAAALGPSKEFPDAPK
jgi:membrane-bound lytic murein transglycosylase A